MSDLFVSNVERAEAILDSIFEETCMLQEKVLNAKEKLNACKNNEDLKKLDMECENFDLDFKHIKVS